MSIPMNIHEMAGFNTNLYTDILHRYLETKNKSKIKMAICESVVAIIAPLIPKYGISKCPE